MNSTQPHGPTHDDPLTIEEVEAMLRVPRSTLASWRYRHIGPRFVRLGRHVRYLRSDIDAYLAERVVSTESRR